MRYRSTRSAGPADAEFEDVMLTGLAPDGGLYLPETWPALPAAAHLAGLGYAELLTEVVAPFVEPSLTKAELARAAESAYAGFRHPEIAPVRRLSDDRYLLELIWGPTLSFKDYALALVGRLFDLILSRQGRRITVVGATSGDTGSAAIEACRDRDAIDVFILHPRGRVSEVQRRQMTTVTAPNVHNLAVAGTFDDCQDLVKALFADRELAARLDLAAVNSINWGRIMAQIAYYVWAALAVEGGERALSFAVPTGNFGNAYAGYAAHRMGLPIERLIVGSNRNHGITTFLQTGRLPVEDVRPTISPAMDIQVPSNLERLLAAVWEPADLAEAMAHYRRRGELILPQTALAELGLFRAAWFDDAATEAAMARTDTDWGLVVDPHTAIGLAAANAATPHDGPVVAIATAHPSKFPEAVAAATGRVPELPADLFDLVERPERMTEIANDLDALRRFVEAHARR